MRKLLNLFGMVLIAVIVFFPVKSNAAGKNICQTLKTSQTYYYNLDKKGKKESIRVDVVFRKKYRSPKYRYDVFDVKAKVTINGKQIYAKTEKEVYYFLEEDYLAYTPLKVMVTDMDKKDKQMELLIFEGNCVEYGTEEIEHIYYYQYANGRAKRKQDLVSVYRQSLPYVHSVWGKDERTILSVNNKNEISAELRVDIPNFSDETITYTKVNLILNKGKFIHNNQKLHKITHQNIPVRTEKDMDVYTSPGGKEKVFTVKKGGKINLCNIYLANKKKIYLQIKSKKGKTGYIDPKNVSIYVDERDLGPDSDYWD